MLRRRGTFMVMPTTIIAVLMPRCGRDESLAAGKRRGCSGVEKRKANSDDKCASHE